MRNAARLALAAGLLLAAALPASAQTPDYEGEFFTDFTHTVPARTQVEISRTLRIAAEQSRIHPILVVIDSVSSYPGMPQDVKGFARRLNADWKIGDVDTHKSVVALFAIKDRKFDVEHSDNVDRSVTDSISRAFAGATTQALKNGDTARAMQRAAEAIAASLPRATATHSSGGSSGTSTPTHTKTVTTRTHTANNRTSSSVPYTPPTTHWSSGSSHSTGFGLGCFGFIIVSVIIVWVLSAIFSALSGVSRGFGRPYHGYSGGYGGYGGGGYGGGGGGSFLGGMATGGLLGYLFGNSGSHYHSGWGGGYSSTPWSSGGWSGGGSSDSSYTDTTTTETWSWGGGSSDSSSSYDSGSSGGGFFDSFGGSSMSNDSGSGGSW